MKRQIKEGDKAPKFESRTSRGELINSDEILKDSHLVLFFYPMDFSPGCTKQACAFGDSISEFESLGAKVVGVSGDSDRLHERFISKYQLPYPLISDKGRQLRNLFGLENIFYLIPDRVTIVIDKAGVVRGVKNGLLQNTEHVQFAKDILRSMNDH